MVLREENDKIEVTEEDQDKDSEDPMILYLVVMLVEVKV